MNEAPVETNPAPPGIVPGSPADPAPAEASGAATSAPDAAAVYRRHRDKGVSQAQIQVLIALSGRGKPCTAAALTVRGQQGSTVRTLQCLAAKTLVGSEMLRPDGQRPALVYALTESGREFITRLLASTPTPEARTRCHRAP